VRYHETDAEQDFKGVKIAVPEGYEITGVKMTDSKADNRNIEPDMENPTLSMERNSIVFINMASRQVD